MDELQSTDAPADEQDFSSGFVILPRSYYDTALFPDPLLWQLFTEFLRRAAFKVQCKCLRTGVGFTQVTLQPGQFTFGRKELGEKFGWPEKTAEGRAQRIRDLGFITIENARHFSIGTIVNYEAFQSFSRERQRKTARHPPGTRQAPAAQRPGTRQAPATKNNSKKAKNTENTENGKKAEKDEARRDDHLCALFKKWEEVEADVQRLAAETKKKVHFADPRQNPKQSAADRQLRIKVCYLVAAGVMPENWLHDASEAVFQGKDKDKDAAYWQTCLQEGAQRLGKSLPRLLVECNSHIPREVLDNDPRQGTQAA